MDDLMGRSREVLRRNRHLCAAKEEHNSDEKRLFPYLMQKTLNLKTNDVPNYISFTLRSKEPRVSGKIILYLV